MAGNSMLDSFAAWRRCAPEFASRAAPVKAFWFACEMMVADVRKSAGQLQRHRTGGSFPARTSIRGDRSDSHDGLCRISPVPGRRGEHLESANADLLWRVFFRQT